MASMAARLDLLAAAVRYAARGWPVLPCHTPVDNSCSCAQTDCSSLGKHPRLANGPGRRLGAGIDVRGDGGYVLAPPSLHVCGLRYEAIDTNAPIAPMPSWMAELATPPPRVEPTDRAAPFVQDGSAWARAALDS